MRLTIAALTTALSLVIALPAWAAGTAITYTISDQPYEGYQVKAKGSSKGLVLVIHDWDGLTDYEVKRANMLSELGYDAFAVDLYGKGNRPVETGAKKAEMGKLFKDRETFRNRILSGLAEARKTFDGAAVVMGYCFGGAAVLELARSGQAKDVKGYVSFHGGLTTPDDQNYSKADAPILIAHGAADASISMQAVAKLSEELEAAKATYTIEVYSGAPHAFTVFGSDRYQKRADNLSWASFKDFLKANLTN